MGGALAVTVRCPDGREYRMERWTNALPFFVEDLRFYEKDLEWWNRYCLRKLEDERDRTHGLYPDGYGIVLIDAIHSTILSAQGYTSFGRVLPFAFKQALLTGESLYASIEPTPDGSYHIIPGDPAEDIVQVRDLFNAGRITHINRGLGPEGQGLLSIEGLAWGDFCRFVVEEEHVYEFKLNTEPFKIVEFDEHNPEQMERLLRAVQEMEFTLTSEELRSWKRWIDEDLRFEKAERRELKGKKTRRRA